MTAPAMLPVHVQRDSHAAFGEAWARCERAAGPRIRIALVRLADRVRPEYHAKATDAHESVVPVAVAVDRDGVSALTRLAEQLEDLRAAE